MTGIIHSIKSPLFQAVWVLSDPQTRMLMTTGPATATLSREGATSTSSRMTLTTQMSCLKGLRADSTHQSLTLQGRPSKKTPSTETCKVKTMTQETSPLSTRQVWETSLGAEAERTQTRDFTQGGMGTYQAHQSSWVAIAMTTVGTVLVGRKELTITTRTWICQELTRVPRKDKTKTGNIMFQIHSTKALVSGVLGTSLTWNRSRRNSWHLNQSKT